MISILLSVSLSGFVSGHSKAPVVDGYHSSHIPQVTALPATLFLLFINNLLNCTSYPVHSYADVYTLHFSGHFEHRLTKEKLTESLDNALSYLTT